MHRNEDPVQPKIIKQILKKLSVVHMSQIFKSYKEKEALMGVKDLGVAWKGIEISAGVKTLTPLRNLKGSLSIQVLFIQSFIQ